MSKYYDKLIELGVNEKDYSREKCYQDYVEQGVAKIIFVLTLYYGRAPQVQGVVQGLQYFHDKLVSFMKDNQVDPNKVDWPLF